MNQFQNYQNPNANAQNNNGALPPQPRPATAFTGLIRDFIESTAIPLDHQIMVDLFEEARWIDIVDDRHRVTFGAIGTWYQQLLQRRIVAHQSPAGASELTYCLICMDGFTSTRYALGCLENRHFFHGECLYNYLDARIQGQTIPNCPVCRSDASARLCAITGAVEVVMYTFDLPVLPSPIIPVASPQVVEEEEKKDIINSPPPLVRDQEEEKIPSAMQQQQQQQVKKPRVRRVFQHRRRPQILEISSDEEDENDLTLAQRLQAQFDMEPRPAQQQSPFQQEVSAFMEQNLHWIEQPNVVQQQAIEPEDEVSAFADMPVVVVQQQQQQQQQIGQKRSRQDLDQEMDDVETQMQELAAKRRRLQAERDAQNVVQEEKEALVRRLGQLQGMVQNFPLDGDRADLAALRLKLDQAMSILLNRRQ